MTTPAACHRTITHTLNLIERLFNEPSAGAGHVELMAQFAPAFSMVTTAGTQLHRDQLCDFFQAAAGKKQGLAICVADVSVLHEADDVVVAGYVETQKFEGRADVRVATALFVKHGDGDLRWLRLQETMCI